MPLYARSVDEYVHYLAWQPCKCGSTDLGWDERWSERRVEILGRCNACGRRRDFDFEVDSATRVRVGGFSDLSRPSRLLDRARWLRIAERYRAPWEASLADPIWRPADEAEDRERAVALARAAAAIDEALLFEPGTASLEHARDVCREATGVFDGDDGLPRGDPPPARTPAEVLLFVRARRCPCGTLRYNGQAQFDPDGEHAVFGVRGTCPHCSNARGYEFVVPWPPGAPAGPHGYDLRYAGDPPSQLLDPGLLRTLGPEFGDAGDAILADAQPHLLRDPFRWNIVFELLAGAVAGYDDLLLRIPAGADRVPAQQLRTPSCRLLLYSHPDAFHLTRLMRERAERVRRLDAFMAAHPRPPA